MISHRTHRLRRTLSLAFCVLAVIAALVVVTVGRGTNPANLLPRVTASSSDSKALYVDFSSVVNLPLGARVLSRGTQIGTLESIALVPNAARLRLQITPQARLGEGTKAELRQSTLLGDIYVALIPPSGAQQTQTIPDGAVIGLADTDPGPQIENIITNLADFMSGGSILRVQDSIRQINRSVDIEGGDIPAASRVGAQTIEDLAQGQQQLDAMIDSLQTATTSIASNPAALGFSFGPDGQTNTTALFKSVDEGFKLVAGSSQLALGLSWLAPRLAQLNPLLAKLVPILRSYSEHSTQFNGNAGKIVDIAQNKVTPFTTNGAIAIDRTTINGGDADKKKSVAAVLTMIGALR